MRLGLCFLLVPHKVRRLSHPFSPWDFAGGHLTLREASDSFSSHRHFNNLFIPSSSCPFPQKGNIFWYLAIVLVLFHPFFYMLLLEMQKLTLIFFVLFSCIYGHVISWMTEVKGIQESKWMHKF